MMFKNVRETRERVILYMLTKKNISVNSFNLKRTDAYHFRSGSLEFDCVKMADVSKMYLKNILN